MADDPNEVTMWSESVFEGLYLVLRKSKDEDKIKMALRELIGKGYKRPFIVEKVRTELGDSGAAIVERVFAGASPAKGGDGDGDGAAKAAAAQAKKYTRKRAGASVYEKRAGAGADSGGFIGWLRSLFSRD